MRRMNLGLGLFLLLAAPLLMGQMCGAPAADPAPAVAQVVGKGLDPGIYFGTLSCNSTTSFYGPSDPVVQRKTTEDPSFSLTVSANGLPLDSNGREIAMGSVVTETAGPASIQGTVTSLSVGDGTITDGTDAAMTLTFPDQSTLILTGPSEEVVLQVDSDTLTYSGHTLVAGTKDSMMATLDMQCSATLNVNGAGLTGGVSRLEVNDKVRAACLPSGFLLSDSEIDMELSRLEVVRNSGTTYEQMVQVNSTGCTGPYPEVNIACLTCWTAMVDQVYGK